MKKFSVILILIIANIIFFNKQLIKIYCSYKKIAEVVTKSTRKKFAQS